MEKQGFAICSLLFLVRVFFCRKIGKFLHKGTYSKEQYLCDIVIDKKSMQGGCALCGRRTREYRTYHRACWNLQVLLLRLFLHAAAV